MEVISQRNMLVRGRHVAIGEEIELPTNTALQYLIRGWVSEVAEVPAADPPGLKTLRSGRPEDRT